MIAVFVGVATMFVFLDEEAYAPAPTSTAPVQKARETTEEEIPPFHRDAESAKPFPTLLEPARFEIPVISKAYQIAHEIPDVLAQQPCYCNCGVFGHGSLLDCFATDHGATWTICLKEVFLAQQLTEAGRTPSQIREEIIRGAWQAVDLEGVD